MFEKKNISARIDNRSYENQGLNLIPTIHEGVAVREMEKRGIHTNKGDLNRFIRSTNAIIKELSKIIADLVKWIFEELNRKPDYTLYDLLCKYLDKRNAGAYSDKAKVSNLQKFVDATEFSHEIPESNMVLTTSFCQYFVKNARNTQSIPALFASS